MKQSLLVVLLFCAAASVAQAPDSIPRTKGYFGIAFGAGFPLQDFLAKDFTNEGSGFANTGSNLQLNYARRIVKQTRVVLRLNINTNPYDVYELAKSYNTRDTFNAITYSVNAQNWYCAGGMVGLEQAFPINRLSIELRALAGYQYAQSPQVRTTLSSGSDSTTVRLTSGSTSGLVWTAGAGVYYQITKRTSAGLAVEYYSFKGTFRGSKVLVDEKPLSNRNDFDMNISILNCSVGIRFHF